MSKDKEKEKGGLSDYRSKSKLVTYLLVAVWLVLIVCSAILFGIDGQSMINVYNGINTWTSSTLGMFAAAIVLGCLGIIFYVVWAVLLFKKPKENVVKAINKPVEPEPVEKEKEVQKVESPTPAVVVTPTTPVAPVTPAAPVAYPRPALVPRPVGAPVAYPRPVAPAAYPRPVAYPQQATLPPRPAAYPQRGTLPPRPAAYPQRGTLPPRPVNPTYYPPK